MTIDEIVTLIQAVSDNGLTSFEYEEGGQKLVLKKKKKKIIAQNPVVLSQPAAQMMSPLPVAGLVSAPAQEAAQKQAENGGAAQGKEPEDLIGSDRVIVSPLVGTFYASANPESEPFVQVGDTVKKGQVLGIVEAMKLMNEIESEYDGVVEAVLVESESLVEYGQPLFRIR